MAETAAAKVEGKWLASDGVVYVKFLGDGRVRVAGINEEKGEFKLNQQTVVVTTLGDAMYVNFPLPPTGKPEHYTLGRLTTVGEGDAMVLYGPRLKVFQEAVEGGKLKGEVKKGENVSGVVISDRAALEKFLSERPMSELFDVDKPLVLTRIGEKKKEK